jgi:IclR family transcriptional regulator, pca regulon regulatory protein
MSVRPAKPGVNEPAVGPLERGLTVLRAMSAPGQHRLRPSDLVHLTGLARATVDRVVSTLVHIGYLRETGRDVALAPRLLELGNAYLTSSTIPDALGPFAERLASELDESVSLAVSDADGVRFVTRVSRRRLSVAFRVGDLLPAERCAAGPLFAREWTDDAWYAWQTRRDADPLDAGFPLIPARAGDATDFRRRCRLAAREGWAADDQLVEPGLLAVAVPVTDAAGHTLCAVSVSSHASRHTIGSLADAVMPRLLETVAEMEAALATHPAAASHRADPRSVDPRSVDVVAARRELGAGYLQSLARGLAVLASFGAAPGGLTLTQVGGATGLPRATARRLLLSLEQLGYVESEHRWFRPLPRVLELGYAHLSELGFAQIAQPHLERLADEVHESASATVLDGDDIRYVARVPTHRIMSIDIGVGTRFPAHATSMGRVLLAGRSEREAERLSAILREVAEEGYALVDGELEEGLRSIAVPIRDACGRVVAAINLSTHTARGTVAETRVRLLEPLRRAAAAIEADYRIIRDREDSRRRPVRFADA